MTIAEMNHQTREVFDAVLANKIMYSLDSGRTTLKNQESSILVSQKITMTSAVVRDIVEITVAFGLSFYVECVNDDIVIRIY
nr:MAG TPA: hypothetical protein [Caudoviricetes sp.]